MSKGTYAYGIVEVIQESLVNAVATGYALGVGGQGGTNVSGSNRPNLD